MVEYFLMVSWLSLHVTQLCRHQHFEFTEVYFPIPIEVGLEDHRVDLSLGHRLSEVVHREPENYRANYRL